MSTANRPAKQISDDEPVEPQCKFEKAAWDFIKKNPRFTRQDFGAAINVSTPIWTRYFHVLLNAGVITRTIERRGRHPVYTSLNNSEMARKLRGCRQTDEGAIWQVMRMLKTFTVSDIVMAIADSREISRSKIQSYCTMLTRTEYLRALRKARGGSDARYRLIRDSGPLPPVRKRTQVIIDQNEDRVVYVAGRLEL